MTALHRAAAVGFARSADAYERGRPGYPDDAVDRLVAALPGPHVVDLAAGTGKLTRALVARDLDVVAVEPVAEMRAAIGVPARVLDGTAEAIPLPDASADALTVAQAFHWFLGPPREEAFVNDQILDADGLADRFGSISFVAALGECERAALLEEIRALAADGTVVLSYVVELALAVRR